MSDNKNLLFIVSSGGLGNAARCAAVIEALPMSLNLTIATSGKALELFARMPRSLSIIELRPAQYAISNGGVSVLKTLAKIPDFIKTALLNYSALLQAEVVSGPFDTIIIDSAYNPLFLWPRRRKVISINNSPFVFAMARKIKFRLPPLDLLHLLCVEFPDFVFQSLLPRYVLVPTLGPRQNFWRKDLFRPLGLLVRKAFSPALQTPEKTILIVPSGAGNWLQFEGPQYKTAAGTSCAEEMAEKMKMAMLIVTNGGLSTLSEAIATNKPILSVPIKGHSEQYLNANWIADHGYGRLLRSPTSDGVNSASIELINTKMTYPKEAEQSGAELAADSIIDFLKNNS